ncbi:fluoride efflux transporter CrcB [Gracilibacillus oryzae]|uniref:Fluoride-specific ion channel FluC n=1 Tax=Gracilibacillus oryzae TaxID=1672701 RepID=A0A7C8KZ19_9BACI|nr:fluoride efflux transporter CrcB [Gracilibacillus oryzae]KAB8137730.1 fluoride efflux transporter CrcB [Gracilibacillus oryzae]
MSFVSVLLVGIGGFFGAIGRYTVSQLIKKKFACHLPVATLLVNLSGSFLLGMIIGSNLGDSSTLLLGTGFMGAFTTFSTFKLEAIQLYFNKRKRDFIIYQLISYGGGICLAFLGIGLGQYLT